MCFKRFEEHRLSGLGAGESRGGGRGGAAGRARRDAEAAAAGDAGGLAPSPWQRVSVARTSFFIKFPRIFVKIIDFIHVNFMTLDSVYTGV